MASKLEDVIQILSGLGAPGATEFVTARKGIGVLLKSYEILKDEDDSQKLTKAKNLMKGVLEDYAKRKLLVTAGLPVWSLTLPKTKEFAKFITGKEPKGKSKEKILMNVAKIEVPEELLEKSDEFIQRLKDEDNSRFLPQVHSVEVLSLLLNIGRKPKKGKDGFFEQVQKLLLPGHKYCGSGTDIVGNIIKGVEPRNYADSVCMLHDIDYLKAMAKFVQSGDKPGVKEQIKEFMRDTDERLAKVGRELQKMPDVPDDTKKTAFAMEKAMEAKILAENTGVLDPLSFLGKTVELSGKQNNKYVLELSDILNFDLEKKINPDSIEEEIKKDMPRISVDRLNEILDVLGALKSPSQAVEDAVEEGLAALRSRKGDRTTVDIDLDLKNKLESSYEEFVDRAGSIDEEDVGEGDVGEGDVGKADEEGVGASEAEKVSEEKNVLENDVLKSLKQAPQIPTVEPTQASQSQDSFDVPIIGERSMRPLLIRQEGDQVELSEQQIKENRLWLDNFNWIDPGYGNGNQERLPWNFTGGKANNSLYEAQEKNAHIRFSGNLNNSDQHIREKKPLSNETKRLIYQPMIPNIQNEQKFFRNGAMPAGLGRPVQMMRTNPMGTPFQNINKQSRRLVNPDIVRGKRFIQRV